MNKIIYFDMDGTIADLYSYPNWLEKLRTEKIEPFKEAKPMFDEKLIKKLNSLKYQGWKVGVISWLPMNASKHYEDKVRYAKKTWLKKHFIDLDEMHFIKYGKSKHKYASIKNSFLVDDNVDIMHEWSNNGGIAINGNLNIVEELGKLW